MVGSDLGFKSNSDDQLCICFEASKLDTRARFTSSSNKAETSDLCSSDGVFRLKCTEDRRGLACTANSSMQYSMVYSGSFPRFVQWEQLFLGRMRFRSWILRRESSGWLSDWNYFTAQLCSCGTGRKTRLCKPQYVLLKRAAAFPVMLSKVTLKRTFCAENPGIFFAVVAPPSCEGRCERSHSFNDRSGYYSAKVKISYFGRRFLALVIWKLSDTN